VPETLISKSRKNREEKYFPAQPISKIVQCSCDVPQRNAGRRPTLLSFSNCGFEFLVFTLDILSSHTILLDKISETPYERESNVDYDSKLLSFTMNIDDF